MASQLKEQINDAVKTAMKAGDKARLGTLRLIMAAIKQYEVDNRVALDDDTTIDVLNRMAKQRRESISQFEVAGRTDLVEQEKFELGIITSYLPQALTADEVAQSIDEAIASLGAVGIRDMGKVMGLLSKQLKGRADMAAVSAEIKKRLGGLTRPLL